MLVTIHVDVIEIVFMKYQLPRCIKVIHYIYPLRREVDPIQLYMGSATGAIQLLKETL